MIDSKRKGANYERKVVRYINSKLKNGKFKKVAGSGAIGTIEGEPYLMGDINGIVEGFNRRFKLEAKVGYGGSKQIALKKIWLDKIKEQAEYTQAIPAVICRFSNARSGVEEFVAMDLDDFIDLLNYVTQKEEIIQFLTQELEECEDE